MKKSKNLLLALLMIFAFLQNSEAQIWNRIKKKAKDAIEKKADKEIKEAINGETKKEDVKKNSKYINKDTPELWRDFRFIPGENVIFFDDLKSEETGEFPSRWDLVKGNAEIAELNGEKVIILTTKNQNVITPLFKTTNYLGDEFTIEYDILVPNFREEKIWQINHELYFDSRFYNTDVRIELKELFGKLNGWASNRDFKIEDVEIGAQNDWHHISISYYKGKYKMYYDSRRISNLPKFHLKPNAFALNLKCYYKGNNSHPYLAIKNIRIAHGGGEIYKRISSSGKYITNGIIFESGKTEIKKQSLGIINKIVKILKENTDWKLDIIGHTDNNGTFENNLNLSSERAEAVKKSIVAQGIKADRLTVIGKGQAEPLNTNSNEEEKANNRRVAFVKK